jgi:hypothetical protein
VLDRQVLELLGLSRDRPVLAAIGHGGTHSPYIG